MVYGGGLPILTASYSGFVNGDTSGSALSGSAALSCAATPASVPGAYTIFCTQGTLAASNYNFTFLNGTLTVLSSNAFIQRVANKTLQLPATPPQYGYALTVLTDTNGANIGIGLGSDCHFYDSNIQLDIFTSVGGAAAVPEPATLLLVGTGIAAAYRRRRKQVSA
jgi:hypothetical protein